MNYSRKMENKLFDNKKLSEIIEIFNNSSDPQLKGSEEMLQKAIERFGDITYKEFFEEGKIYELYDIIWE